MNLKKTFSALTLAGSLFLGCSPWAQAKDIIVDIPDIIAYNTDAFMELRIPAGTSLKGTGFFKDQAPLELQELKVDDQVQFFGTTFTNVFPFFLVQPMSFNTSFAEAGKITFGIGDPQADNSVISVEFPEANILDPFANQFSMIEDLPAVLELSEIPEGSQLILVQGETQSLINKFVTFISFEPTDMIVRIVEAIPEPVCGNEIVEGDEECDDGNDVDNDECSNLCQSQIIPDAVCGNGIVEKNEQCDDGNKNDDDECHNTCVVGVIVPTKDGCSLNPAAVGGSNLLSGLILLSTAGWMGLRRRISK